MILGHLTEQVLPEEVGALQGAAVSTCLSISISFYRNPQYRLLFACHLIMIREQRQQCALSISTTPHSISHSIHN